MIKGGTSCIVSRNDLSYLNDGVVDFGRPGSLGQRTDVDGCVRGGFKQPIDEGLEINPGI